MTVWESIALHTTPEIPRYKQPEVRLVTLGVEYDVFGPASRRLPPAKREAIVSAHPRTDFKAGIVRAFYEGMRDKPETTYAPWHTDVLEEAVPGYRRPNFCRVRRSRFAS